MGEIELPLDSQGFLRRECPICGREFKWHHGPTEGVPVDETPPESYYCPYCGEPSPADEWWTREQVEAIQQTALREAMPQLEHELREAVKPLNRSGFLKADVKGSPVNPPSPLFEPDDMTAVASPCHPYEPVKISSVWPEPLHCLVCGARYVV